MKGWGNLSFGSVKGSKGLTDEFYGFIKSRKSYIFVIPSPYRPSLGVTPRGFSTVLLGHVCELKASCLAAICCF